MLNFTINLKNVNYKSYWNILVFCNQWKMMSDLNVTHGKMYDFVSLPFFGFTLVRKLRNFGFQRLSKLWRHIKYLQYLSYFSPTGMHIYQIFLFSCWFDTQVRRLKIFLGKHSILTDNYRYDFLCKYNHVYMGINHKRFEACIYSVITNRHLNYLTEILK